MQKEGGSTALFFCSTGRRTKTLKSSVEATEQKGRCYFLQKKGGGKERNLRSHQKGGDFPAKREKEKDCSASLKKKDDNQTMGDIQKGKERRRGKNRSREQIQLPTHQTGYFAFLHSTEKKGEETVGPRRVHKKKGIHLRVGERKKKGGLGMSERKKRSGNSLNSPFPLAGGKSCKRTTIKGKKKKPLKFGKGRRTKGRSSSRGLKTKHSMRRLPRFLRCKKKGIHLPIDIRY